MIFLRVFAILAVVSAIIPESTLRAEVDQQEWLRCSRQFNACEEHCSDQAGVLIALGNIPAATELYYRCVNGPGGCRDDWAFCHLIANQESPSQSWHEYQEMMECALDDP